MTTKNTLEPFDDDSTGVLDDAVSVATTGIGIIGVGTAQVSVVLPAEDDDDLDDDIVEGEVDEAVVAELLDETVADNAGVEDAEPDDIEHEVAEPVTAPTSVAISTISATRAMPESVVAAPVVPEPVAAEPVAAEPVAPLLVEPKPAVVEPLVPAVSAVAIEPRPTPTIEPTPTTGTVTIRRAEARASEKAAAAAKAANAEKARAPQPTRTVTPLAEQPASRRLGDLSSASESADLLTADRLLDPHRLAKPEPEGAWSHLLYSLSGRRINIGDGRRARERKALTARIAAPLPGGARFVPVLSRKGGVGKTAITALLGMAMADAREDRVIAVDANPDRGTLADRIVRTQHTTSVRDLVRIRDEVRGYHDISAVVARDATRLDVLASDADPRVAEAFSDSDYRDVAGIAAHYYSLVLTDTGTGIVHSVMSATLDLADRIVIVSGLSIDEARLASETLTWLETNGYAEQAKSAVVVLNHSTPGTPLVRVNELEAHFASRVRSVIQMPYDAQIAAGGTIVFANLQPETRRAARELAAQLVEALRAEVTA